MNSGLTKADNLHTPAMRKIYHIGHDRAFASISVDPSIKSTDISKLQGDRIEQFEPPVCRLTNPSAPIGNFVYLNDTTLIYDDKADHLMQNFIEYASEGESYQLEIAGIGTYNLLNVVEICNPVNKQASEWVPGSWQKTIEMKKLVFHPKRVGSMSSLFKIPELDYEPILCFSGFHTDEHSQQHDFYAFYHDHGFTGLSFNEIWSDG